MSSEHTSPLRNIKLWTGLVFFTLVMLGLIYLWHGLTQWLEDEQRVPLRQILIAGERTYLKDEDIRAAVKRGQTGSFFELDVDKVHNDIEALPWVYKSSVRKEWPDTLRVYVVEQTAVARWHDDMLLNQYGGSFQAQVPETLSDLPMLLGPGGSEKAALEGYRSMQELLQTTGLRIVELSLSERFAWQLRLHNDIDLNLGRTEFMGRLQRFIDIYPLLLKQDKAVSYVDLRYDTGLAVGWKELARKTS